MRDVSARAKIMPARDRVSPEVWAREVESFTELLKRRPSKKRLLGWVQETGVRRDLFGQTVIGTIRWPKELGRPGTPTLAEGFVGIHQWWFHEAHFGIDGAWIETDQWAHGDPPSMWDAPEAEGNYRVHYMFPERANPNWIEIKFSNAHWIETGSRHLPWSWSLNPRGFIFTGTGGLTVLPPITVERRLLLH